jgi:DNA-binding response OmpR family regulator
MEFGQLILFVENNEKEANTLKLILESEGFSVDYAYSGWAALEKLRIRKYASVILDYGFTGYEGL